MSVVINSNSVSYCLVFVILIQRGSEIFMSGNEDKRLLQQLLIVDFVHKTHFFANNIVEKIYGSRLAKVLGAFFRSKSYSNFISNTRGTMF